MGRTFRQNDAHGWKFEKMRKANKGNKNNKSNKGKNNNPIQDKFPSGNGDDGENN